MHTPPLSPINTQDLSSVQRSPALSFRSHARRTSSFSSNHDRSPATPRSRHRFSNASRNSGELRTPIDLEYQDSFGGKGNLADELDQLDDTDDYGDEVLMEDADGESKAAQETIRDSGIDVSYTDDSTSFDSAKPPGVSKKLHESEEDQFPPGLDDAIDDFDRLCSKSRVDEERTIPSFVRRIQDLGNQSAIETGVQRLNTSVNSISAHLDKETKSLQTLGTGLLPPFSISTFLDREALEEVSPMLDNLIADLPLPDTGPLQDLQKLSRETDIMMETFASLLDTLQISKQTSNTASRQLRTTQTIAAEMRRERERAEEARYALSKSDAEEKIRSRWAAQQCKEVVSGFDSVCNALQRELGDILEVSA